MEGSNIYITEKYLLGGCRRLVHSKITLWIIQQMDLNGLVNTTGLSRLILVLSMISVLSTPFVFCLIDFPPSDMNYPDEVHVLMDWNKFDPIKTSSTLPMNAPVRLLPDHGSDFNLEAGMQGGRVVLTWFAVKINDDFGFVIERRTLDQQRWTWLSSFAINEDLSSLGKSGKNPMFDYIDRHISDGELYWYRVSQIDGAGQIVHSETYKLN